ncbi:unnamed protein product [Cyclocybe aegerita]|uniref:Uncharacterized protein n=1 Tax=Cyclocybe aegerita TaxID=1973307 RepID=A0A8S0W7B0_CYCAE|nr:unnamed protein product [Cyclocybe aegerita]
MSSRRLDFLIRSVAFIAMLSFARPVLSTPIPLPLLMAPDYSPSLIPLNRSISRVSSRSASPFPLVSLRHSRDVGPLDSLTQYHDAASKNANNLKSLAAKSATTDNEDYDFQQACASELSEFSQNMQGIQEVLVQASPSDKGLANYDRDNDLETLLKNVVNLNKDVLNSTTAAVYNIPGLGPTLGPIVYNLKCLIDQILDALEDYSDATINQLTPLLQGVFGKTTSLACDTGVVLAGLCI